MLYGGLSRDPNQNVDDKGPAGTTIICVHTSPYNIRLYKFMLK